ncbi:MAG: hypothetical protein ACRDUY_10015 [Nitriliruptorales bacterium]
MPHVVRCRLAPFAGATVLALVTPLVPARAQTAPTAAITQELLAECDDFDPAACLLPFPNDVWTREDPTTDTGKRVAIPTSATPTNTAGKPIDTTEWNRNDGFSPGALVITVVPNVDLEASGAPPLTDLPSSLDPDSPIVLLNADTGERHPFWAELDAWNEDLGQSPILIRPARNLEHGARYIVALRDLVDRDGNPIEARRSFENFRDGPPGRGEPPAKGRRAHMEDIFSRLADAGVERDDLYLAWDFTVASARSMFERVIHMRDDAFADLGDAAPNFVIDEVEEQPDDRIARRITGRVEVPNYLDRPGGPPTSRLNNHTDPDGVPTRFAGDGTVMAPFWCNVPRATTEDASDPDAELTPGRAGLYGHGLLGTGEQVSNSYVRLFADEHNYSFCATSWWGMATEDVPNIATILADMSNFPTLPDRSQQGLLNFLFLGRAMIHPDGFLADDAFRHANGEALWDASDLFYHGNSQGGIMGGALMAIGQDFTRGILGVPGMNYSTLLDRSVDWDPFHEIFANFYPDRLDQQIVFSMIQMLWDRAEANGYAHHITDPYDENTPAKTVMLQVAFADHQVTMTAAEVEARTVGASIHQPALDPGRHFDPNPYWGIPAIPYDAEGRWDGSAMIVWDSGNDTPPVENLPPREDRFPDPHGHPRRDPDAMRQMSLFLKTNGWIQDVCFGPCYTVQHPAK